MNVYCPFQAISILDLITSKVNNLKSVQFKWEELAHLLRSYVDVEYTVILKLRLDCYSPFGVLTFLEPFRLQGINNVQRDDVSLKCRIDSASIVKWLKYERVDTIRDTSGVDGDNCPFNLLIEGDVR